MKFDSRRLPPRIRCQLQSPKLNPLIPWNLISSGASLSREQKKTPSLGSGGHMLHTTGFLQQFSKYREPEFTIPLVAGAGIDWVREPLYQGFFSSDDVLAEKPNKKSAKENRDRIEKCLAEYDRAGIARAVVLHGKATILACHRLPDGWGSWPPGHPCAPSNCIMSRISKDSGVMPKGICRAGNRRQRNKKIHRKCRLLPVHSVAGVLFGIGLI